MSPAPRFLSLEAFRGIFAIVVILCHSRLFSADYYTPMLQNAYVLMDFFFILSGFVMAYSYAHKIGEGITFGRFVRRRFARLYPLHLFTLFLWIPYIIFKTILYINGFGGSNPSADNNTVTFLSNLALVHGFDGQTALSWNYPSWSISVEFYTYLLFFLVIFFVARRPSIRITFVAALAISIISYGLLFILHKSTEIFLFECIGGFFLGVSLYMLYKKMPPRRTNQWVSTTLEAAVLALLLYCMRTLEKHAFDNYFYYLTVIGIAMLVWIFVIQDNGYISRLLHLRIFQHLGKISYSMYMLHAIILAITENILVYILKFEETSFGQFNDVIVFEGATLLNVALIVMIIGLSTLSYRYIELPFQARFQKLGSRVNKEVKTRELSD